MVKTSRLGFAPTDMINPDLGWETTGQYNIGLDFSLLRAVFPAALKHTGKIPAICCWTQQLPTVSGFNKILVNIGKTTNKGF